MKINHGFYSKNKSHKILAALAQEDYLSFDPSRESFITQEVDETQEIFELSPNTQSPNNTSSKKNKLQEKPIVKFVKDEQNNKIFSFVEQQFNANNLNNFVEIKHIFDEHVKSLTLKLENEIQEKLELQHSIESFQQKMNLIEKDNARLKNLLENANKLQNDKIKQLITDNGQFKKEVDALTCKCVNYENSIQSLNSNEKILIHQHQSLLDKLTQEFDKKIHNINVTLQEKESQILNFQNAIKENNSCIESLRNKITSTETLAETDLEQGRLQIENYKKNEDELKEKLKFLEHQLAEQHNFQNENQSLKEIKEKLEQEQRQLVIEKNDLGLKFEKISTYNEDLKCLLEETKKELEKLSKSNEDLNQKVILLEYASTNKKNKEKKNNQLSNAGANVFESNSLNYPHLNQDTSDTIKGSSDFQSTKAADSSLDNKLLQQLQITIKKLETENHKKKNKVKALQSDLAQAHLKCLKIQEELQKSRLEAVGTQDSLTKTKKSLEKAEMTLEIAIKILSYYEHFTNECIKQNFSFIERINFQSQLKSYCEFNMFKENMSTYNNHYINIVDQLEEITIDDLSEIKEGLINTLTENNEFSRGIHEEFFCQLIIHKKLIGQNSQKDQLLKEYEINFFEKKYSPDYKNPSSKYNKMHPSEKENNPLVINKSSNAATIKHGKKVQENKLNSHNNQFLEQTQYIQYLENKVSLIVQEKYYLKDLLDLTKELIVGQKCFDLYNDVTELTQFINFIDAGIFNLHGDPDIEKIDVKIKIKANNYFEIQKESNLNKSIKENISIHRDMLLKKRSIIFEELVHEIANEAKQNELNLHLENEVMKLQKEKKILQHTVGQASKKNSELIKAVSDFLNKKKLNETSETILEDIIYQSRNNEEQASMREVLSKDWTETESNN